MQKIYKNLFFQIIISLILLILIPYGASFISQELVFPVFIWTFLSLAIFAPSDESAPQYFLSKVLLSLTSLITFTYFWYGIKLVEGETLFWQVIVFPGIILLFWHYVLNIVKRIESDEPCIAKNSNEDDEAEQCEADCQCADCLEAHDVEDLEDSLDFIRSKDLYAEFRAYQDLRVEERQNRNSW